ncbi:MAG TPA: SgcJ/EcaC family oxidoreductase [Rudaea sp.]|nr:SgcJ/EcaC family oxidoreductase [Rudaea sp.]
MTSDEKEIRDLIETWMKASKAGDTATVLGLMSAGVVFLLPGQKPMRGRKEFEAAQSEIRDIEIDGHSDVQEIQVNGDWAYCWNFLTITFTPKNGGPSGKRAGNVLTVLRKENGRWVIFRDANLLTKVDG